MAPPPSNFAFGGSLSINSIADVVTASVTSATLSADKTVSVTATESPVMVVLAGGIAISGSGAAVGAAIAYNYIGGSFDPANPDHVNQNSTATDQVGAFVKNSSVTATHGDLDVLAGYQKPAVLPGSSVSLFPAGTITLPVPVSQALVSVALGGAGGDAFALGGAVNVNLMRGSAAAEIVSTVAGKTCHGRRGREGVGQRYRGYRQRGRGPCIRARRGRGGRSRVDQ